MIWKSIALVCILTTHASAVKLRVATFNIGAHFNTEGNIDHALNAPGTADYQSVLAVLARIDADVVALEEIAPADIAGDPDSLDALAAALGYSFHHTASASQALPLAGPIDTTLRVTFLSRFPFLETGVVRSPEGAKELTRLFPVVTVDVPGTAGDPILAAVHLKSGTGTADRYRRAVEMTRLAGFVADGNLASDANFILMGDFNLSSSPTTFTSLPPGLPGGFHLGADLAALPSITYSLDPVSYFASNLPIRLDPRQTDGSTATYQTGSAIDLFLVSSAMAGRPIHTEIYNSILDGANGSGLGKAGSPPDPGTSAAASDHYAVFGDFELDENFPPLLLTTTNAIVIEGGEILLTVSLPEVRSSDVTTSISSDDATLLSTNNLVIPAGALSGTIALRPVRNFLADGGRVVTYTATAAEAGPALVTVQLLDADGTYLLAGPGAAVVENFTGFAGDHAPAPWLSSGGSWLGADDGGSPAAGFRSYGGGTAGFLADGAPGVMEAKFINTSRKILTDVRIGFTAEKWRPVAGGNADRLEVGIIQSSVETGFPELTVGAENLVAGEAVFKSANVSGLSVKPGDAFTLKFSFVPGEPAGLAPANVFINEFHYDNKGTDAGEFVELVTGPGFLGNPDDVNLILYNGGDGKTYGSVHPLATFAAGDIAGDGYHIHSKAIPGIQNGDPDGFALVVAGVVTQFISYGGSFQAMNGPAAGMVSEDVGLKQNAPDSGFGSIGLAGSGGSPGDFSWIRFDGLAHSPGHANPGQDFVLPTGSQGLSIDDVTVTYLPSSDRDGDGISDADEFVFGTDPLDRASGISVSISSISTALERVKFMSVAGRNYVVESSNDLMDWKMEGSFVGTGDEIVDDIPIVPGELRRFYRVGAVLNE